ncbi:hypothetical protein O1611_g3899 [Lasiodiplodia mahajangana]|uniref:Uncharacterized protein n=1 Tax=Lasiodiplodia mahajangana TaxID=1108764 RepID=A0ACC2JQG8_9PEZI|nr:hypothetical protein O1611_g3899 [Lasiodiplodia mahajangana]
MPPSKSSKPKPTDVAAEAKKHYIPMIRTLEQIPLAPLGPSLPNPEFYVCAGDPVDFALDWEARVQTRIPFICVANDKRPGGDWETAAAGYEERLCKRSTLSATLATPGPGSQVDCNYPISSEGGIYSEFVVVFRGPHDQYKKLDQWHDLPVVSMPAIRWPKLSHMGSKYAFPLERDVVKDKLRSALRICAYYGHRSVVIGDFGLGNTHRNPPRELAEMWRDVFLFDPEIRGRFDHVAFSFDDVYQNTTKILDDIARKHGAGHASSSKGKSKASTSSSSHSTGESTKPTDFEIFQHVFSAGEIHRLTSRPDPRYDISMLTS